MQEQQVRPAIRNPRVDEVVTSIITNGFHEGRDHTLVVSSVTSEVWVRHVASGMLVAYSSAEADRLSSIEEFTADYLV